MTIPLHPSDPRVDEALEDFADCYGFDAAEVLLPGHWFAAVLDGKPQICLNRDGMRALAIMSPDPSAPFRVDQLLRALDEQHPDDTDDAR